MNRYVLFLCRLYAWLLSFYPRRFRQDFSPEMQAIFETALVEASASGQRAAFFLQELRDWPHSVLFAHLHERRNHPMPMSSSEKPIRWWGVLAGIGIFLLPIFGSISGRFNNEPVAIATRLLLFAFILAVFLFGIFKGLARWCSPTLGLLLGALWMFGGLQLIGSWLIPWMNNFVRDVNESSRYIWQAIMNGVFWGSLLIISMFLVLISSLLPSLRPLYRRVRSDWTLVSFTLYGATLFALFIDWDEYTHEEVFVALCYAFLALGAAGYLLSKTKNARMVWLLSAVTLTMVTMAVGKFILVPLQDWPMWSQWHSSESERWFESLSSLIELGWILIALLAPSLLMLLLPIKEPSLDTDAAPLQFST